MVRHKFTQNVSKLFPFPIIYVNSISNSPKGNTKRENCSWNNNHWVTRNVPQKHCQNHIIQLGSNNMYQKRLKMVFNSKNTLFAEHYANVNGNSIKDSLTSMNEGRTRKSNDRSCENQSPILASKPFFFQSNNCCDLNIRFVCAFRWKMTLSEIQEMKADVKRIIEVINSAEKLSNHSETWQSVWNLVYMRIFFASAYVTKNDVHPSLNSKSF